MLKGETQIRQRVEGESCKVYDSAAEGVGEGGENGRGQGLEDDVEGYGKIDRLDRGMVVGTQEREEGEVDRCRQRGSNRSETEQQGQKALLTLGESRV